MNARKYLINGFNLFVLIICITIFIFENVNGKFFLNDFKVYYNAARALVSGDQVYGIPFGLDTGLFKYSPLILLFFIPISLLPYYAASVVFYIIIVFSILFLFNLLRFALRNSFIDKPSIHENIIYSLAFVFVLNQVYRDLHLGNTNTILVLLLISSLVLTLRSKHILAGILLGIAVLFKPYFLILILPAIIFNKWKTLMYGTLYIALHFVLFMFIFGPLHTFALHSDWITAMMDHSTSFPADNTIDAVIRSWTPINLSDKFQLFVIAFTGILYIAFAMITTKRFRNPNNDKTTVMSFIFGWISLLAFLPNIVKTDSEHFLYALPLIAFITYYLFLQKNWWLRALFFLLFLLHGTNSSDMVGRYLSDKMAHYGILGISNILIVLLGVYIFLQQISASREMMNTTQNPGNV